MLVKIRLLIWRGTHAQRPSGLSPSFCNADALLSGVRTWDMMTAILRAIDEAKMDINKMVFVSGIGCAGWIPSPHFNADTLHTTHGRPIAFATGVKLANPELKVVVISGDGDLASIGGNHLIHAARRNFPITVICANNGIYGMTGGQASSTTPISAISKTTPAGNIERPFDLCKLVIGAGATYAARFPVVPLKPLIKSIINALNHGAFPLLMCFRPARHTLAG